MENAGEADQIAALIIPSTDSQEEEIQSCHFTRESEVFSGDMQLSSSPEEASEQATGIVMVSMQESSDDYQTPPEHHLSSQNSSNDGQVTTVVDLETGSGGVGNSETMVMDDSCERMIDLTTDSDNLEFLENRVRVRVLEVEDNNTVMADENNTNTEEIETQYAVGETNAGSCVAEALKTLKETVPKVFVEMPVREQETESKTSLNLDCKGKRQLPFSMKGKEKNNIEKHEDVFTDILNRAWKILVEQQRKCGAEADGDDDLLETAMRRGLTLPRPRWWPPEEEEEDGFEG
ncbi:unnamed protein product [Lactuca saligna]|uniref:Uncharacterized protein n=1 Tax=Lactuca saligna TaxID=75948 RepID=A0AA35YR08_LACSI|nr:unnamed protein product [Lactuca saligna]